MGELCSPDPNKIRQLLSHLFVARLAPNFKDQISPAVVVGGSNVTNVTFVPFAVSKGVESQKKVSHFGTFMNICHIGSLLLFPLYWMINKLL